MSEELECFKRIKNLLVCVDYEKDIVKSVYEIMPNSCDKVQQALQCLESINNAKPSEALESLEYLDKTCGCFATDKEYEAVNTIKQALLKAQEQEKENVEYKQLEEQIGCPLETVIEHINESYKMLCQHIEINEKYVELKKYRDIVELSKISYDIAISKEQKGLCEKYFTWLRKGKSEQYEKDN